MTSHTEAREAVARIVAAGFAEDILSVEIASVILARLGELGYVQRDRLIRGNAVLAAAKVIEASEETMLGWVDIAEAAIAAAIEKAQNESYSISGGSLDGSSNLPNTLTSRPNVNRK